MITQACNLSCVGCTNYSDLVHKGYVTWEQGRRDIASWLQRVDIPDFGIMGGEPLMNPECKEWIYGVRELMPAAQIRFTTNGLLLDKHYDIVEALHEVGNAVLKISVHNSDHRITSVKARIFNDFDWKPVTEFGIKRWATTNNLRFQVNHPDIFYKSFRGEYRNMMPHSNDPAQAFETCIQQQCPLLYNGRIYKCSTSALLMDTLDKVGRPNYEQWSEYITTGLNPGCNDQELKQFLQEFGKPIGMCSMCPTKNDLESMIDHGSTVSFKKVRV